jgi:hypothetical protein
MYMGMVRRPLREFVAAIKYLQIFIIFAFENKRKK